MLAERSVCACVCVSNLLLLAADESDTHSIGLFCKHSIILLYFSASAWHPLEP
jgi:hypothetical protein